MSITSYNPALSMPKVPNKQVNFTSNDKQIGDKPLLTEQKATRTGKILGGVAAYSVISYPVQKFVVSKVLPRIHSSYKPLAEAMKEVPIGIKNMMKVDPEKITKLGDEVMKLSTKGKAGLMAASMAAIIGVIALGVKAGSLIQQQIQK